MAPRHSPLVRHPERALARRRYHRSSEPTVPSPPAPRPLTTPRPAPQPCSRLPPSPPPPSPPPPAPAAPCANRTAAPQVIVKEERQLNEPKPRVTLKHPWNPEDLAGRPNTWNPVRQKPREDTDKMCVRQTFPPRYSRSTMLHERRSDEVLQLRLGVGVGVGVGHTPWPLTLSLSLSLARCCRPSVGSRTATTGCRCADRARVPSPRPCRT